ncbi:glycosyltransferase family 2 protein [Haloarcula montana]|uniref:glycosyltransferase family 2 protein n=1 Tax=Haloarcula montana TaxID=3111776 RepID=UPI002D7A3DD0|nr:glycosyltransferase [Haloarcula sp. GH36]
MRDVSVVIPTYERKAKVKRAVDSALDQTVRPKHIVIVDDGSSFDTAGFLNEEYETGIVDVVQHDHNQGASQARNTGVDTVRTDYVAFLDSDDYWAPTKLERQLERARETNAELIYCDQWIVDETGETKPSKKRLVEDDLWMALLSGWTAPNTSTLLFETETFRDLGGFDTDLPSCQDHDLWMRAARENVIVAAVPERLAYFTQDADNRISTDGRARLAGARTFLNKWRNDLIRTVGWRHYYWFRWQYVFRVALPVVRSNLSAGQPLPAVWVALSALAFNPVFYARAGRTLVNRARSG